MAHSDLALHEQIMLLVLTRRDGSLLETTHYQYAVAGGILAQLVLDGYVELEAGSSGPLVTVIRSEPMGDPVLDDALEQLRDGTRRASPRRWIGRFAEDEELHLRVTRQLCRKGVVDEHPGRARLIFLRSVYVDLDPDTKESVVEGVRQAIFGDGPVDVRTAVVTALAGAGDVLRYVFDPGEVLARGPHIRALVDNAETGEAVREALREAEAAVVSATDTAVLERAAGV